MCLMTVFAHPVHAASATLSLSPASASVTVGDDVTLTIQVNAGSNQITGAQACLVFDSAKVTFKSISAAGSALSFQTPPSSDDCPGGEPQISRFDFSTASGTFTLGTVTFTAAQGGTSAAITFDNIASYVKDNATLDGDDNPVSILTGSSGSALTLNAVPSSPAPSSSGSSYSGSTGSTTTPNAAKTPSSTAPKPTAITSPAATSTSDAPADTTATPNIAAKKAKPKCNHLMLYGIGTAVLLALGGSAVLVKYLAGHRRMSPPIISVVQPTQPPAQSVNDPLRPHSP